MSKKSLYSALAEEISQLVRQGRELEYPEGAVGITGLIYCPRKVALRKEHPEVEASAVEIDQGFLFERVAKAALARMLGKDRVTPEEELPYESPQGLKIVGHLDAVVRLKKSVLGLEFKRPKMLYHRLPSEVADVEVRVVEDQELARRVHVPENWILQARIQKWLLARKYPGQEVHHVLFILSNLSFNGRGMRMKYVVRKTEEDFSQEEMEELVRRFLEDPTPRYGWECEACAFAKAGLCEGVVRGEDQVLLGEADLSQEVLEALKEYRAAWEKMKDLEAYLKQAIPRGTLVKVKTREGLRKVGWRRRKKAFWDTIKLVARLGPDVAPYLQVNWRKADELEAFLFERKVSLEGLKKEKEGAEWRGL